MVMEMQMETVPERRDKRQEYTSSLMAVTNVRPAAPSQAFTVCLSFPSEAPKSVKLTQLGLTSTVEDFFVELGEGLFV